jgi:hypothetical protein
MGEINNLRNLLTPAVGTMAAAITRIDSDVVTLVETVAGLVLQMLLSRRRTSVGAMRPAYVHWLPFTWAYY